MPVGVSDMMDRDIFRCGCKLRKGFFDEVGAIGGGMCRVLVNKVEEVYLPFLRLGNVIIWVWGVLQEMSSSSSVVYHYGTRPLGCDVVTHE